MYLTGINLAKVCPKSETLRALLVLSALTTGLAHTSSAQTFDVRNYGAVGNGSTDDSAAIQKAINSSTDGSTVVFGTGSNTFLISRLIDFKPNRTYTGGSTIKMNGSVAGGTGMIRLKNGQTDNTVITNLTFDASKVGGILLVGVDGTGSGVKNVSIRNNILKNSRSLATWENAIYIPVGLTNSTIAGNSIQNSGGIYITDPNNSVITENQFDIVLSNAISVIMHNNSSKLEVSKNTGRKLTRMALEVFGDGRMDNLTVTENNFSDWQKPMQNDAFGFSLCMRGTGARVANNVLSGTESWYGIEVGAESVTVEDNTITGFGTGIILQGQNGTLIQRNRLIAQYESAILFANVNSGNSNSRVLNNYIENARKAAIGAYPNNYGNSEISGNEIVRQVGFHSTDTGGSEFLGIKIDAGVAGPIKIRNNSVVQTSTNPNTSFSFQGIAIFSKYTGNEYTGNRIESKSGSPYGNGMLVYYPGLLDGITVSGNTFTNLGRVTSGNTSANVVESNNVACKVNVNDPNIITSTTCSGSVPSDTTAPVMSSFGASNITQSQATATWITDEASDSQIEFGTTTGFGMWTSLDNNRVVNHSVTMTGLSADTTYYYRLRSKDASGNLGSSPTLSFRTPSNVAAPPPVSSSPTPTSGTFFRGINLGGNSTTVDGEAWVSHTEALSKGLSVDSGSTFTSTYKFALSPSPDAGTLAMLQSGVWRPNPGAGKGFTLNQQIPNGTYQVYFWMLENYQNSARDMDIRLEGATVASGVGALNVGAWVKYGPYQAKVSDGILKMEILQKTKGDPHLMGVAIYTISQDAATPPVSSGGETFLKGINCGGNAVTIEGNRWLSHAEAVNSGLTISNALAGAGTATLTPSTDADSQAMIGDVIWRNGQSFSLRQSIANGKYNVYIWTLENYRNNYRDMDVRIEGNTVASRIGDLPLGAWRKYGPYQVQISDGVMDFEFLRVTKGDPQVSGIAIFKAE